MPPRTLAEASGPVLDGCRTSLAHLSPRLRTGCGNISRPINEAGGEVPAEAWTGMQSKDLKLKTPVSNDGGFGKTYGPGPAPECGRRRPGSVLCPSVLLQSILLYASVGAVQALGLGRLQKRRDERSARWGVLERFLSTQSLDSCCVARLPKRTQKKSNARRNINARTRLFVSAIAYA